MTAIWLGLLPVLPFIPYHQRYDTGQGYAEDARPHADVAVVAGLRRGAGGLDCRLLHVLADFTGAGLFPVFSGCCLFGDDPFAEGMGFFGDGDLAAAGPFLFVGGLCGRPFLRTGVVRGILFAVLPAAKSGILAGVILGVGRAIGEATAVKMVAGNQPILPTSILSGVRTLTSNIVVEMGYAEGLHREALIATAVVLFVFILLINLSFSALKKKEG